MSTPEHPAALPDDLPDDPFLHVDGLDYDFLRYIDVTPESQRRIQQPYLAHFAGCARVVDLGCGDGDFVALLREAGIDGFGVDADDKAAAAMQAQGLPIVHQDVFTYLANAPAGDVDGIFCAHLVEHLPYPRVLELIHHAMRILRPGGRIILATPDCRSIFSHLEMFYLHFGHVSFYHPRLLAFMLEHEGFTAPEIGVNANTLSPMLPGVRAIAERAPQASLGPGPLLAYRRAIPPQGSGLLRRISFHIKQRLARWLVLPFTDSLAASAYRQLAALNGEVQTLARALDSINGPFEVYVRATKPAPDDPA